MSISTFTILHVVISLIAILSGLVVLWGLLTTNRTSSLTSLFLITTVLTTLTGFLFPITAFTPALGVGIVSTVVLVFTLAALYVFRLRGPWRWIYVGGAVLSLYLNVFVLVRRRATFILAQAISVVTQDQIEDQKPRTLNETLSYTASANPNGFGFDSRYDAFTLRGFPTYYNGIFRDGLRQYNGPSAWFKTEPYGIEGLTVLKGPASSLYGISGPGGIVNLVTKRPKDEQFREVELLFGEDNRYQKAFDFSGPANEDGTLLYRMTGLGRMSDTDLPGYPDDKLYIAPAMTWKPDEDTKLTVLAELSRAVTGGTAFYYNPAYGRVSDLYEGDPDWNDFAEPGPHRLRVRAPLQRPADGSPERAIRSSRRRSGVQRPLSARSERS